LVYVRFIELKCTVKQQNIKYSSIIKYVMILTDLDIHEYLKLFTLF